MAVEADLDNNSTKIIIGVVALVTSTIKIVEEFIVFVKYKVSELEVFKVAVAVTKRVRKSIKVIRQQW